MGWSVLIAELLKLFGPLLTDWLKSCTEERLERAAANLPAAESFGSEGKAVEALYDEAIDDLPRFAFIRRAALRRMKSAAVTPEGTVRRTPLTASEMREGRDLVGGVRNE